MEGLSARAALLLSGRAAYIRWREAALNGIEICPWPLRAIQDRFSRRQNHPDDQ
jgi:hypothetical protein